MRNKLVIPKIVEFIESNIDNDSKRKAVVSVVRAEYGVKDGSRIASKHLLHVEEQVARAIVESGAYPDVTTKLHGKSWAISHPDGRKAASSAKKMKQRVMQDLREGDDSKKVKRTLLDEFRSLRKKAGKAADAGKINTSERDDILAEIDGMSADLSI